MGEIVVGNEVVTSYFNYSVSANISLRYYCLCTEKEGSVLLFRIAVIMKYIQSEKH